MIRDGDPDPIVRVWRGKWGSLRLRELPVTARRLNIICSFLCYGCQFHNIDILNDALSRTFYTENVAFPCLWPRNIDRTSAPVNQTRQRPVGLCGYFHFQRENSTITNRYPITANGHYFVKKSRKKIIKSAPGHKFVLIMIFCTIAHCIYTI